MKAQLYSGWFEDENGAVQFSIPAMSLTDLYVQLVIIDKHEDLGQTDMEIFDGEGNDVTMTAYNLFEDMRLTFNKENTNDTQRL